MSTALESSIAWEPVSATCERGFIEGQPEITLFFISWDLNTLDHTLLGAFIPDTDEQKRYASSSMAKRAARAYMARWLGKNT